jgi:hypothetical protein
MTGSACRSTRNAWNRDGLRGPRQRTARWAFRLAARLHARRIRLAEPASDIPARLRRVGARGRIFSGADSQGIVIHLRCGDRSRFAAGRHRCPERSAAGCDQPGAAGRIAELAIARAKTSDDEAMIAHQKLRIAKLQRMRPASAPCLIEAGSFCCATWSRSKVSWLVWQPLWLPQMQLRCNGSKLSASAVARMTRRFVREWWRRRWRPACGSGIWHGDTASVPA